MAEKITATTTITETESVLGEKYHTVELKILMSYSDWCQFSKSQLYKDLVGTMFKTERRKNMDIDIDGYAERYWSEYDPAFQDEDDDEDIEDIEEEDEEDDDDNE